MEVTKGTWHMHKYCVLGSLSASPKQERGNKARQVTRNGERREVEGKTKGKMHDL